jgi:membrane protein DedA with SNARE-associated domain
MKYYRIFAYYSASLVLGLGAVVLTIPFIEYVEWTGWVGYGALAGYAFVYFNLSFGLSRRFTTKAYHHEYLVIGIAALMMIPPTLWTSLKDVGLVSRQPLFLFCLALGVILGCWAGYASGLRRRARLIEQAQREGQELPEELRRSHEKISHN